jgi:hypothetical protein
MDIEDDDWQSEGSAEFDAEANEGDVEDALNAVLQELESGESVGDLLPEETSAGLSDDNETAGLDVAVLQNGVHAKVFGDPAFQHEVKLEVEAAKVDKDLDRAHLERRQQAKHPHTPVFHHLHFESSQDHAVY